MRVANWQTLLNEVLTNASNVKFDFETHNCLFFSLKAIDAQTDRKLFARYKNAASSPQNAAKNIRKMDNVKTCQELLAKQLGQEINHIALARPGDIVFLNEEREDMLVTQTDLFGPTPGVCNGALSYFVGENGLVAVETLSLDNVLWVS